MEETDAGPAYGPTEFDLSRVNQNIIPHILRKLQFIDLYHMRATCKRINEISLSISGYFNPTPLTLSVGADVIEKVPIMHRYYGRKDKLFIMRYYVKKIVDEDEFLRDCRLFNILFKKIQFFDDITERLQTRLLDAGLTCKRLGLTNHHKSYVHPPRFGYLSQAIEFREFVMEKPVFLGIPPEEIMTYDKFRNCPSLTLQFQDVPLANIYETFKNQETVNLFSYSVHGMMSLNVFIKEVQQLDTAPHKLKKFCLKTRVCFSRFNLASEDDIILVHQEMSMVEEGKPYKKLYVSRTQSEWLIISGKIEEVSGIKPVIFFCQRKKELLARLVDIIDWRRNIDAAGYRQLWREFRDVQMLDMPAFAAQRVVPKSRGY